MAKENVIKFNKVNSYMVFDIFGENLEDTVTIEVGCGEDIETNLDLYQKENWTELFDCKGYDRWSVHYAKFKGIQIYCEDENGSKFRAGNDFGCYGSATLNIDNLAEENAKKLNEIRKILNT